MPDYTLPGRPWTAGREIAVPGSSAVSSETAVDDYLSSRVGSSAKDSSSIVNEYKSLFAKTGDYAWLEKYYDAILERENTESARSFEERMSNTGFSRLIKDIEAAGYNPWIALQGSMSSASTPSVSAAGRSDVSYSSQKTSKENQQKQSDAEIAARLISAVGMAIAALIALA